MLSAPKIFVSLENKTFTKFTGIIYERGDELANALVKTIHVSLIFYNDVYKLKEKVDAEFVQLEKNSNVTGSNFSRNITY